MGLSCIHVSTRPIYFIEQACACSRTSRRHSSYSRICPLNLFEPVLYALQPLEQLVQSPSSPTLLSVERPTTKNVKFALDYGFSGKNRNPGTSFLDVAPSRKLTINEHFQSMPTKLLYMIT